MMRWFPLTFVVVMGHTLFLPAMAIYLWLVGRLDLWSTGAVLALVIFFSGMHVFYCIAVKLFPFLMTIQRLSKGP